MKNPVSFRYIQFFAFLLVVGCSKLVEVPAPKTQIVNSTVFSDEATATSSLLGIYSNMFSSQGFASGGRNSVTFYAGLSADELKGYAISDDSYKFYLNSLTASTGAVNNFLWQEQYKYIYSANLLIEGVTASSALSSDVKSVLINEAKFIRAFCYFYLVNLFGDVPLTIHSDYTSNAVLPRASRTEVYAQIISDLLEVKTKLSDIYLDGDNQPTSEKARPNKWAAAAMLARAYLYLGDWKDAETTSSEILGSGFYSLCNSLDSVFLKNNTEAIWQLMPNINGFNTNEGRNFILEAAPTYVSLSESLMAAFEPGDNRRVSWIDSFYAGTNIYYFPYKYKVKSGADLLEYSNVLRLSELYLIRAESRIQQGNSAGALEDINTIRSRAGLAPVSTTDPTQLLQTIQHERQIEFLAEWGHRWLDLKRNSQAAQVLFAVKPLTWKDTDTLYPIPLPQITNDPNVNQNPGY